MEQQQFVCKPASQTVGVAKQKECDLECEDYSRVLGRWTKPVREAISDTIPRSDLPIWSRILETQKSSSPVAFFVGSTPHTGLIADPDASALAHDPFSVQLSPYQKTHFSFPPMSLNMVADQIDCSTDPWKTSWSRIQKMLNPTLRRTCRRQDRS